MEAEGLILVVVGAHLAAEIADRPVAYRLRERMEGWLRARGETGTSVVVCADLWYLNQEDLRRRPTVSIGGPGVNALTAYLGRRVPSAFTIDGVLLVQMDVGRDERVACCWGVSEAATAGAVEVFEARYLDRFMRAAAG